MRKRKKLNDKGEICVFLGVSEACKAYKLYNPLTKKIVTSKDVIFDEEGTWDWSGQQLSLNILEADFEDGDQITTLAIIERQKVLKKKLNLVSLVFEKGLLG